MGVFLEKPHKSTVICNNFILTGKIRDFSISRDFDHFFQKHIDSGGEFRILCDFFQRSERSSIGRAPPCQGGCREFEPLRSLHFLKPRPNESGAFYWNNEEVRTLPRV